MSPTRPISKGAFRFIALVTLALPFGGTWFLAPKVLRALGDPRGPVGLLVAVLILLGLVLAWAALLLPLRRRSMMPTLKETMAAKGASSLSELVSKSEAELAALASAPATRPDLRRRYHLLMAGAGGIIFLAFGVGTAAMLMDRGGRIFLAIPLMAASGLVLAIWHLVRAALTRRKDSG